MKYSEKFIGGVDGRYAYTFDDVFLQGLQMSEASSRRQIDTSVNLGKGVVLNIPLISANMSTVTDYRLARKIALLGGIGTIHQNYATVEEQVEQVKKVKNYGSALIEEAKTISKEKTAEEVEEIFSKHRIGALVVVDKDGKVEGIVTNRDLEAREFESDKVENLMTKKAELKVVTAESLKKLDEKEAEKVLKKSKKEQVPVLDRNEKLLGLFTKKGLQIQKQHTNAARDKKGKLVVAAAVGQNRTTLDGVKKLLEAGADLLIVDTALGWREGFLELVKEVRKNFPEALLYAGNIDNPKAALDLAKLGVDGVKVGIGPGGACLTRVQTGTGTPQITAISQIKEALFEKFPKVKIIGDGGISKPGNLAKALAAGADLGMLGSMLAGTDLAPGETREIDGKKYKDFRGMASFKEAQIANELKKIKEENTHGPIYVEGNDDILSYKGDGSAEKILRETRGGLQSAFSYHNAAKLKGKAVPGENLKGFYKNTKFRLQTVTGAYEGKAHAFG